MGLPFSEFDDEPRGIEQDPQIRRRDKGAGELRKPARPPVTIAARIDEEIVEVSVEPDKSRPHQRRHHA